MIDLPPSNVSASFREQLRYLVRFIAPSETEEFGVNERFVELAIDRDDPARALRAGIAIYRLKLAMRCFLFEPSQSFSFNSQDRTWIVKIQIAGTAMPSDEDIASMVELSRRRPDSFRKGTIPTAAWGRFEDAAHSQGAHLVRIDAGSGRAAVARMVPEIDQPTPAPAIAVLATTGNHFPARVNAGQALERVLLTAATLGHPMTFFDAPVGLAALFEANLVPQVILRIG